MSTLVFYHLYGLLGLMAIGAIGGFIVGLIIVDSPLRYLLRPLIAHCVVAIITEMLYVRKVVTPFFQFLSCGPALYAIEMWYLSLGLLKGFTRMVTLAGLVIVSNFNPACMFPDGKEATDSAHVCFLCYTAERVAHDKAAQQQWRAAYQEAVTAGGRCSATCRQAQEGEALRLAVEAARHRRDRRRGRRAPLAGESFPLGLAGQSVQIELADGAALHEEAAGPPRPRRESGGRLDLDVPSDRDSPSDAGRRIPLFLMRTTTRTQKGRPHNC